MPRLRFPGLVPVVVLMALLAGREGRAESGVTVSGESHQLQLNFFIQPRYDYTNNDGTGESASSFRLHLAGGRLRVILPRNDLMLQVEGGLSGSEPVLLDSFVELRFLDCLGLRFGYFRVPFDEQTTHAPFWLRMADRSVDVVGLGHYYDLGIVLQGLHLDDSLAWALSMTNGETSFENLNIDFLYSFRLALRFAPLFGWDRGDVVLGTGTSWTLEPWEPEEGTEVNRSLLDETVDLTLMIGGLSLSGALLYRWTEPGAYGEESHALGWHAETGASIRGFIELAVRVAQLWRDLDDRGTSDLEVGVALNGFVDESRLRLQVEYRYLRVMAESELAYDAHRVVVQLLAFY